MCLPKLGSLLAPSTTSRLAVIGAALVALVVAAGSARADDVSIGAHEAFGARAVGPLDAAPPRVVPGAADAIAAGHAVPTAHAAMTGIDSDSRRAVISEHEILGDDKRWALEELRVRFSVFTQRGAGFQSQDRDEPLAPGNQDAIIVQPMAYARIQQSERLSHTVFIPVDIVSAASPDALDAVATASRVNEAGALDITTRYQASDVTELSFRYGFHVEEPLRSWFAGAGYTRKLADDNAAISVSGNAIFDVFDHVTIDGGDLGLVTKAAVNGNVGFSQILSPTTVFDASYGLTYQQGVLQNTWNSVPVTSGDAPIEELFPGSRVRHAASARISQHIPQTRSTVKARYRYYFDDFDKSEHTDQLRAYQYLVPWLYVRGSYRYYTQDGVDFFFEAMPDELIAQNPVRTADSDLAPFDADEYGVKLVFVRERAPRSWRARDTFDASFVYYVRTNDLTMNVFSISYGRRF